MMEHQGRTPIMTALALALGLVLAAPLAAQRAGDVDARWLPYLGCWEPAGASDAAMLCVVPTDDPAAVELRTYDGAELADRTLLHADGRARAVERRGCSGEERTTFSDDGRRVYIHADLSCGTNVRRSSSRMLAMLASTSWIDVEALDIMGRSVAMTRRFTPAAEERFVAVGLEALLQDRLALETARVGASGEVTAADIIDVTRNVDPEAVRAWIAERGEPVELDARRLVAMADAGVPEDIIDVAIAVSYPETFAVKTVRDGTTDRLGRRIPMGWDWGYGYWDPWGFRYPYWGLYSRYGYGYDGWGYGGYWGGYWGGSYGSRVVVVTRGPETGGRAVKGRGYTRSGSGGSVGTAVPRGSASRGGYTSGGGRPAASSGTAPRKAKPRGGSGH